MTNDRNRNHADLSAQQHTHALLALVIQAAALPLTWWGVRAG